MLRLKKLPEAVANYVIDGKLSMGHARALLGLESIDDMKLVADKAVKEQMSVRGVEALVKKMNTPKKVNETKRCV